MRIPKSQGQEYKEHTHKKINNKTLDSLALERNRIVSKAEKSETGKEIKNKRELKKMKRLSTQLNTKDDKQDKNLTKRFVFHISPFLKDLHWVQNNAHMPSKTGSKSPLSATVPLYRNY